MGNRAPVWIFIISAILLSGCWDQIEIEQRAFISVVAIDATDNPGEVKFTEQLVNPENISTIAAGGGQGKPFRNLSSTGRSLFEINQEIAKKASRVLDTTHLDAIIFSEEIMKQPGAFKDYFDLFFRSKTMRRGIKIAVSSGDAWELLEVEAEHEKIPGEYIIELLENKEDLNVVDLIRIGDIDEKLYSKMSFPMAQIKKKSDREIDYSEIAIYNGPQERMIGTLKDDEAKGLSFIRGMKNNGAITGTLDNEEITVEIGSIKSKFTLVNPDPKQMKFALDIKMTASLAEQAGWNDFFKREVLTELERASKRKVEEMVKSAIKRLQEDFRTDAMGLGEYLHHYHPKIWKKIEGDWEEGANYFSNSEINLNVKLTIAEPGSINRTTTPRGE